MEGNALSGIKASVTAVVYTGSIFSIISPDKELFNG